MPALPRYLWKMLHSSNRGANGVRVRGHIHEQEDKVEKSHAYATSRKLAIMFVALGLILAAASELRMVWAQSNAPVTASLTDSELIAQYRHVEVASVSDALEQISGKR